MYIFCTVPYVNMFGMSYAIVTSLLVTYSNLLNLKTYLREISLTFRTNDLGYHTIVFLCENCIHGQPSAGRSIFVNIFQLE